ncbi:MAG: Uma2 family endonuclease [Chitinophagaceae bacterium]
MKEYLTRVNDDGSETMVEEPQSAYGFTYADYLSWTFKERLELIRGKIFKMSAPNRKHQDVLVKMSYELYGYLKGKKCRVYVAPFDVRLPVKNRKNDNEVKTVVQPDLCVFCDPIKLDDRGACGAPDLVMEIISPSNPMHDIRTKFAVYEEAGVREYWIIHPIEEHITVYVLNESLRFEMQKIYRKGDTIESVTIQGFSLDITDTFDL